MIEEYLEVPAGTLFIQRWRPEQVKGAPIVLLHDSLGCVALWRDFPQTLAQMSGREVIAYDRLGFGRSSTQREPAPLSFIDDQARHVLPQLVQGLILDDYVLCGHSVGGAMALAAASLSRHCVGVIAISAQAFVEDKTLVGIEQAKRAFAEPEQFARLEKWHGERARWVLDAWTQVWLAPEFRGWSLTPYLAQVHCPVLVIHGQADEYGSCAFPEHIAAQVAGPVQSLILPGCGHVPHREQAPAVLQAIAAFLN